MKNYNENDKSETVMNVISFLIPLVGLIIYLTQKEQYPIKANAAGKAALWGVGVGFILTVMSMCAGAAFISSLDY